MAIFADIDTIGFGEILQNAMEEKNISHRFLADELSVSAAAVSQWVNGKTLPSLDKVLVISKILSVDVEDLIPASFKTVEIPQYYTTRFLTINDYPVVPNGKGVYSDSEEWEFAPEDLNREWQDYLKKRLTLP